jgi:hypothetical protein
MHDIAEALISRGYKAINKSETSFPMGGLTLADIEVFIDEAGGESTLSGMTTEAVCPIMMEITKDCSYCEYLSKKNYTEVMYFMSTVVCYVSYHRFNYCFR